MCKKSICLVSVILAMVVTSDASADLLGYWNLDEGGGMIAADSSGNGHDGTIKGATWTTGKADAALAFDGVDDYVLCAERTGTGPGTYPESLMPQTFTVSCWTKLDNFAYFSSFIGNGMDTGGDECGFFLYNWGWVDDNEQDFGLAIRTETAMSYVETPNVYQPNTWYHLAATYDGQDVRIYVDGALAVGPTNVGGPIRWISAGSGNYPERFAIGVWLDPGYDLWVDGIIDEVGYWSDVLSEVEVRKLAGLTRATEPNPADGALYPNTWVNLEWKPGAYAASHNVYLGDTFEDVNDGTIEVFRGNQTSVSYIVGFPGFAFPEGLVPGTTYYWRIDEVNDADPNNPWTGDIWSFLIPPKIAYDPNPADGAEFVDPNATFTWAFGFDARLHTVYIGTSFDDVNDATGGTSQAAVEFNLGPLEPEKVYYWRVDEFDVVETHKGDVWGFTTPGAAASLEPVNGSGKVQINTTLNWTPATTANSHDLYFGPNKALVQNATTASPQYKGNRSIGSESYDPDGLALLSEYFWRVDSVYSTGPVKGLVWNFTTADFLLVDDFESYNDIEPPDPNSNRIFDRWIDGFGTTTNGALVGNDLPPYAEQTVIHGGSQSMIYRYDNANKTSEATLTLIWPRDWAEQSITKLSLWFRGVSENAAERMFVAVSGNTVVYHDDPAVTQTGGWTEWVIDLQEFVDQGVDLTNVSMLTIGFGVKGSPAAGGAGTMHFDDIRLH